MIEFFDVYKFVRYKRNAVNTWHHSIFAVSLMLQR